MQAQCLIDYRIFLYHEERSANTIAKYLRDVRALFSFLDEREPTKEALVDWKASLTENYAPSSVNSMLAAANNFLVWAGRPECRVKPLKIQREIFMRADKDLTREEYLRLVKAAERGQNRRLALLLQAICSTGIRVSELRYVTVEAVRIGRMSVDCKGKKRTVFLPRGLCRALLLYCRERSVKTGVIFCTRGGRAIDRTNIWRDMKALCKNAGVEPGKVFPHNLRHLFAKTYYQMEKDLSRLADLLGHSSVNTTRIYTMESGENHARQLEHMRLLLT